MTPVLVRLIHAGTLQARGHIPSRIEKFNFTKHKFCFARCAFKSDCCSYTSQMQIYIYMPILVHKHTYFCLYIHTRMSCKCIQASPGPVTWLITVLWVMLVLVRFSEVMSMFFPCIRLSEAASVAVIGE